MNLTNPWRGELEKVPFLNNFIDRTLGVINALWAVEHNEDGTHGNITATGLTVALGTGNVGTVGGHLAPSANATYDLGVQSTGVGRPFFAWRTLRITTSTEWYGSAIASLTLIPVPSWTETLSGDNIAAQSNVSGNTWKFLNSAGAAHVTIGGSSTIGGATSTNQGVTIPRLVATSMECTNGYFERARSTRLGEWTSVAFAAGNFTGYGAQTWTVASGDQRRFAYTRVGKTITVSFWIITSDVGGTPDTFLQITIPGGLVANDYARNTCLVLDAGVVTTGATLINPAGTTIFISRLDGANFTASAGTTEVAGEITFETTT
jgi:hypothetical protein